MRPLITPITLILILVASAAMAFQFPAKTEVVKVDVTCRTQKSPDSKLWMRTVTTLDSNSSLQLMAFLQTISDQWKWLGFSTTPAGDIQITFWLSSRETTVIQAWFDLERIWTDGEYRKLSRQERQAFHALLPACAQHDLSNQPLEPIR